MRPRKKEGSQGQQEKAFRMLQSRKIVTVKILCADRHDTFVKAMIKKSYGHDSRPAVILFKDGKPLKRSLCLSGWSQWSLLPYFGFVTVSQAFCRHRRENITANLY